MDFDPQTRNDLLFRGRMTYRDDHRDDKRGLTVLLLFSLASICSLFGTAAVIDSKLSIP